MADQPTSSGGSGDMERGLSSAIDRIQRRAGAYNRNAFIIVILAILIGAFLNWQLGTYALGEIKKAAEPKTLAALLATQVDAQRGDLKSKLIDYINKEGVNLIDKQVDEINVNLTKWADTGAARLKEWIVEIRPDLENRIKAAASEQIDKFATQSWTVVERTVREKRTWIESNLGGLDTEEGAKMFELQLAALMEEQLGQSKEFENLIAEFGKNYFEASLELKRLSQGQNLTPDEKTMREILMYAKWLEKRPEMKLPEMPTEADITFDPDTKE
jgi:hypothetical protein